MEGDAFNVATLSSLNLMKKGEGLGDSQCLVWICLDGSSDLTIQAGLTRFAGENLFLDPGEDRPPWEVAREYCMFCMIYF